MIIEGNILKTVLAHYSGAFTELCLLVNSVICCRVTPEQKGQVVALCKNRGLRTLAIGDGGNDVRSLRCLIYSYLLFVMISHTNLHYYRNAIPHQYGD